MKLAVVVITLNEAKNIERCLRSVQGLADEIIVVDSFSTDATRELAQNQGATVLLHPFESYNAQRAYAAAQATTDFVLALDADEYLSAALQRSIAQAKLHPTADCYTFNRLSRFGDTWLRYTSWYPDRKLRLFDRRKVQFTGIGGHDTVVPLAGATTQHLAGDLLHHASDDIHSRVQQLNNLSLASARYNFHQGKKTHWVRIIFKPILRFVIEYVLRSGFRAGFYGFMVATTAAYYVFLRETKLAELWRMHRKTAQPANE